MELNGKLEWIKWLAGILWSFLILVLVSLLTFMGNKIYANTIQIQEKAGKEIIEKVNYNTISIAKLEECMRNIKDILTEVKVDQKIILKELRK